MPSCSVRTHLRFGSRTLAPHFSLLRGDFPFSRQAVQTLSVRRVFFSPSFGIAPPRHKFDKPLLLFFLCPYVCIRIFVIVVTFRTISQFNFSHPLTTLAYIVRLLCMARGKTIFDFDLWKLNTRFIRIFLALFLPLSLFASRPFTPCFAAIWLINVHACSHRLQSVNAHTPLNTELYVDGLINMYSAAEIIDTALSWLTARWLERFCCYYFANMLRTCVMLCAGRVAFRR